MTTIPEQLSNRPQWVTWRFERGTKVPYSAVTGHKASSTKPSTWTTYEEAVKAAKARKDDGVGYVFSADDPFTGIDLDDCIDDDGNVAMWALEIVNDMMSYTEISPSGHGLKIWVEGSIPSSVKQPYHTGKIEMYDRARYFTVTGRRFGGTPLEIRNVNGSLTALYERVKPQPKEPDAPRLTSRPADSDEHTQAWARRTLARAIEMVTLAQDGHKDDTLIAAARLAAGALPYISESEIETALYSAIAVRAADPRHAQQTIRNGIRYGVAAPLPVPPPPPLPLYDESGAACCPVHGVRLPRAKNGNGYKCHEKDPSTATGWCAFWWSGEGYIEPAPTTVSESTEPAKDPAARSDVLRAPSRFRLYRMDDLRALPPVEWLITNELPAGLLTVICGPSGAGKSFQALDYSLSVARRYPDRLVVYVAPEGGGGYRTRVDAWIAQHGGEEPQNLVFVLRSVPLLDAAAVADFIAAIQHHNPVLVVLDTLARCIVGGDENSSKDMGIFVEGCDTIRQATGAAVAVVHHTGKSGGYRGSSALYGACDSWVDVANDDGLITISCGKAKDWKPFEPRYLRMVDRGESCVLLPAEQVTQRGAALTEGQRKVLETLALDVFQGPGAKATQIMSSTGIPEKTLFRILSHLKRNGMISQGNRGDPYTITRKGLDEIKSYHRALRESRAGELSSLAADSKAELSQLSPNSHELSSDSDSTVSHCHPPLYKGGVTVDSDSSSDRGWRSVEMQASEETDLFPDEPPAPQPIPPALQTPAERTSGFDLEYVRKLMAIPNVAGVTMHYRLNRRDDVRGWTNDQIMELAEREAANE